MDRKTNTDRQLTTMQWSLAVQASLFFCSSVNSSFCLPVYPSVCLSPICLCPSVDLSVCLSVYPSSHLSVYLPVYPSFYLSIQLSICLFVYLSIHPSVSVSVYNRVIIIIILFFCESIVCVRLTCKSHMNTERSISQLKQVLDKKVMQNVQHCRTPGSRIEKICATQLPWSYSSDPGFIRLLISDWFWRFWGK